jgi:FAD/FMN-containing dehydrogenase
VAGLTLGGGMGRLQRKHGFTIDNLISVDLVTADGELHRVNDQKEPDLFWALRGAGANFGVVTAFEFRLHPVGPRVTHGSVVFPIERAREAAALYRDLSRSAPRHMHLGLSFATAPTGRASAPGLSGKPTVAIGSMHFGSESEAERDLWPLRHELEPLADTFAPATYLAVQTMGDEEMAWGKRFYMKGGYIDDLSSTAVDVAAEQISSAPGECSIGLWAQGGAIADLAPDATALTGRDAAFWVGAEATWIDPRRDGEFMAWGRTAMAALKPFTRAGHYVNDVVESGEDVVRSIYGDAKYERLRTLKRAFDPGNVFRLNQNIRP